jgi:allantoicase
MAIPTFDAKAPTFTRTGINLADPRLGARSVLTSDDFFAPMARMLNPEPAVFIPGKYDEKGKWMDGWESRRKRVTGHDFCIVKLGAAGELMGVDIDTSHFTGNFPPAASIDACRPDDEIPSADTQWTELIAATALSGNAQHFRTIEAAEGAVYTHIRLNICPDGGVARLRVFGRPRRKLVPEAELDLA